MVSAGLEARLRRQNTTPFRSFEAKLYGEHRKVKEYNSGRDRLELQRPDCS